MAYSPAKDVLNPGSTSDKAAQIGNNKADKKADANSKASNDYFEKVIVPKIKKDQKEGRLPSKENKPDPKTGNANNNKSKVEKDTATTKQDKKTTKGGTYASAKKKDPKLDSYIKARGNAKEGSSAYNAAQNKINAAYGKGPTDRKVTKVAKGSEVSTGVMRPKTETKTETTAEKITDTGIPKNIKAPKPAPKPKTAMDKAKEAIASGDKKAAKKSGLKGKVKRVAKKAAKEVGKEVALDKAAEATTKKEVRKSGVKGKFKRAAKQDVASASKQKKKQQIADLAASASPTTFKSFDQMDSKNAMATAGESPAGMYDGPIKYFKGKINYDIKEASNSNLSQSARNNYAKNAQHDMKSMGKMNETMTYMHGSMKGDQSKTKMDYANFKGTDPKYHGKTGASHGDQSATRRDYAGKKGGSILSKHFKK